MFRLRFSRSLVFCATLGFFSLVAANAATAPLENSSPLGAASHHGRTIKLINYFVERYHYRKTQLDDELSSEILTRYLQALDPNRSYFLAEDIENFETLRHRLDDYLTANQVTPFFELFNTYRQRVFDRIGFALEALEAPFDFTIDEHYRFDRSQSPWAVDRTELNDLWRRRVKNDYLALKLENKPHQEILKTLRQRYQQLARRIQQITNQDVFQTLVNAYVSAIEPHTGYFSPRATENFKIRMSLSLEGIGAVLQMRNEFTVVQRIVPGGAAELEGTLRPGDHIIGVGQGLDEPVTDVIGWRLDDVVDLIRGPKGTTVRLRITPNPQAGSTSAQVLAITRDQIKLEEQAAQRTLLQVHDGDIIHRIGVIDIPTFYVDFDARARGDSDYRSTTRDVRNLIAQMEQEGVDGLVIDLRGNGGGALAEATALTGLFIPSGPVVQVRDSRGRTRINRDPNDDLAYAGPLAVIVDRDSASASEIFSGAIQDYERGLVIGESTFGKGTVQNLIDLDRYSQDPDQPLGQLKLTIAQFFRVNGESTQHRGVVPDIILPIGREQSSHGERALDNALPWTQINATDFSIYEQSNYLEHIDRLRSLHRARVDHDPDFAYLKGIRKIEAPLAELTEVPLLESLRSAERVRQQDDRQALLKTLVQAHGLVFKETEADDDDLPRDAVLLESARILADLAFGAFAERLIVQLNLEPTPINDSGNNFNLPNH